MATTSASRCMARRAWSAAENQRAVSIEIANGAGFTRPPLHDFFMTRYTDAYAAEIEAFIAGLRDGAPLALGRGRALAALALADAAVRSVAEGRKVKCRKPQ